jgi:hypothetical protein
MSLRLLGNQYVLETRAILVAQRGAPEKFDYTHNDPPVENIRPNQNAGYLARWRQIIKLQLGHSQLWRVSPVIIRDGRDSVAPAERGAKVPPDG